MEIITFLQIGLLLGIALAVLLLLLLAIYNQGQAISNRNRQQSPFQ
jgi:hypothetical protein